MKAIVLFAGKYGATCEIAKRISQKTDGAVVHNLMQGGMPDLQKFDCIIIGSSVYAGMIRKEAKAFLSKNTDVLLQKKTGLFISGLEASGGKEYFENNFPPGVLQAAKAASFLGGIYDPKKCNMAERLIMKAVTKQSGYVNTIDDVKIDEFVKALKS